MFNPKYDFSRLTHDSYVFCPDLLSNPLSSPDTPAAVKKNFKCRDFPVPHICHIVSVLPNALKLRLI